MKPLGKQRDEGTVRIPTGRREKGSKKNKRSLTQVKVKSQQMTEQHQADSAEHDRYEG